MQMQMLSKLGQNGGGGYGAGADAGAAQGQYLSDELDASPGLSSSGMLFAGGAS